MSGAPRKSWADAGRPDRPQPRRGTRSFWPRRLLDQRRGARTGAERRAGRLRCRRHAADGRTRTPRPEMGIAAGARTLRLPPAAARIAGSRNEPIDHPQQRGGGRCRRDRLRPAPADQMAQRSYGPEPQARRPADRDRDDRTEPRLCRHRHRPERAPRGGRLFARDTQARDFPLPRHRPALSPRRSARRAASGLRAPALPALRRSARGVDRQQPDSRPARRIDHRARSQARPGPGPGRHRRLALALRLRRG